MQVSVDIRGGEATWDEEHIVALATFALEHLRAPQGCELSVSLVSAEEIHELNREYRGIDRPTDVLSFECDDPWAAPDEPEIAIGDVIIAPDVIEEQRAQFGTTFEQEISLMLVHGCLHVLGYDHIEPDEAEEMEALEKEILEAYGMPGIR